jgi:hypothetical protein
MKSYSLYYICIIISVAMASLRIGGVSGEIFQALAHIWIGGLLSALVLLHYWPGFYFDSIVSNYHDMFMWSFWILCLVEVACFVFFKFF